MRVKANSYFLVIFCFLMLQPLVTCVKSVHRRGPEVKVNRKTSTITINAHDVRLSDILQRLHETNGIRVVVPNFKNRKVSITAKDRPLTNVLDELVAARYWVVVEEGELFLTGSSGRKSPRVELEEIVTAQESVKPDLKKEDLMKRRYAILRFRIEDGKVMLKSASVLRGEPIRQPQLIREYVYQLELDGKVVDVGSFPDPFRRHVYFPEKTKPHEVLQAKSGMFNIFLPGELLDEKKLIKLRIHIFKMIGAPPVKELTLNTIGRFEKILEKQYSFDGQGIVGKLKEPAKETK